MRSSKRERTSCRLISAMPSPASVGDVLINDCVAPVARPLMSSFEDVLGSGSCKCLTSATTSVPLTTARAVVE